jgi:hypothetical protein
MSLAGLVESKRLRVEPTSADEINGLIGVVERSLKDASVEAISEDLRFIAAYNALLESATMAIRASGHRVPAQSGHHVLTFETLQYTIGADGSLIRRLKAFANRRGKATYDAAGMISEQDLRSVIRTAGELQQAVMKWLREHHAELLKA